MPKPLRMCLCVGTLLFSTDNAAHGRPEYALNGIKTIYYSVIIEDTVGGDQCKIDNELLTTSLQFIANQSTKLQIITATERNQRVSELSDKSRQEGERRHRENEERLKREGGTTKALFSLFSAEVARQQSEAAKAETREFDAWNFMPELSISISPLQNAGGCSGHIEANLSVHFEGPVKVIPTGQTWSYPQQVIWSKAYGYVYSRQDFSQRVINIAEQLMKAFVNDWTASQRE